MYYLTRYLNNNLPKMRSTLQILQSILRFLKRESLTDNRMDLMLLNKPHHLLKPIRRPNNNTLQSKHLAYGEDIHIRLVATSLRLAGSVPNAVDQAVVCGTVKALAEGFGTADFEDDVCAVAVCDFHDFLFPVGGFAVVDGEVCAESFGFGQFVVRGGSNDHFVVSQE